MKNFFIFILFITVLFPSCNWEKIDSKADIVRDHELKRILESGKLRVVVDYNSTSYFVYKGNPMGFQYELLQELAKDMHVKLEIMVTNNMDETFRGLRRKKFDLIAKNLIITKTRLEAAEFTVPLMQTRQVLVQRKPEKYRQMSAMSIENHLIRNQLDLAGKTVHVQNNSSYYRRMLHLSEEIGEDIIIQPDSIYGVEQLVAMVAKGEIDFTVCDENVARVNQTYYPNLDVKTPVSFPQNIAWAVRKGSSGWLEYLNAWIVNFSGTSKFRILYQKYFENSRSSLMVNNDYHSLKGRFSEFDDMIKEECAGTGFDWRLIAAIIYKESQFNPEAQSWAGAYGLMQLMPETAETYNVGDIQDPRMNIRAGIKNLKWLDEQFISDVPDSTERIKFVLAAYNVGLGHVIDARRLAKKYDKDPAKWDDNVDYFMLNKSSAKFYRDRTVKWGYCQGSEPYNFVNNVISIYMHYKNAIPELTDSAL
ncbi:MAG: lytic transglycosylase F [Bacteroidetes bacterium GWF2_42_66]|nr:MAG: lytic transglycosylase F [Bacteroidetes bacterium GWA2_42_15]OFY01476.1 MAG: lytic transglycosylase F [Bacteroidetes bacterium GWE2_42_39]OFY43343.1 MAG: lytic transglycosylase F [Bacteroidetes bacterium GWF2_42_66]HBL77474.1 lytic transglycosylase F [Prolixibacteraceae bacterium]HCR91300.1 lytic transglycosylase F [Prolixibacteraceae bacterium]